MFFLENGNHQWKTNEIIRNFIKSKEKRWNFYLEKKTNENTHEMIRKKNHANKSSNLKLVQTSEHCCDAPQRETENLHQTNTQSQKQAKPILTVTHHNHMQFQRRSEGFWQLKPETEQIEGKKGQYNWHSVMVGKLILCYSNLFKVISIIFLDRNQSWVAWKRQGDCIDNWQISFVINFLLFLLWLSFMAFGFIFHVKITNTI